MAHHPRCEWPDCQRGCWDMFEDDPVVSLAERAPAQTLTHDDVMQAVLQDRARIVAFLRELAAEFGGDREAAALRWAATHVSAGDHLT